MMEIRINKNRRIVYMSPTHKPHFTILDNSGNLIRQYFLYLRINEDLFSCSFILQEFPKTTTEDKVFKVTDNIISEVLEYIISIESEVTV